MMRLIGQGFGILATIAGIALPVFKKKWQMLVMSICNNVFCGLNLIFLNEIGSGIFLFIVAAAQAIVNLVHALRDTDSKLFEKILFIVLYLGLGFYGMFTSPNYIAGPGFNFRNLQELLPIVAASMNMLFVFSKSEKTARMFFVLCNALWLVYNIIIGSSVLIGSAFSVVTGLIALFGYSRKKTEA